jgi:F-box-like
VRPPRRSWVSRPVEAIEAIHRRTLEEQLAVLKAHIDAGRLVCYSLWLRPVTHLPSNRTYVPNNENVGTRDTARALISRRLTKIRGVVDEATAVLSSDHNAFLLLYRLPDELLVEIFHLLAVDQLIEVTLVSKRFHSVAFSAHKLWSTINVPLSSAHQARLLIQRSGMTGLKVCVKEVGMSRQRTTSWIRQAPRQYSLWSVDEFTAVANRIEYLDGVVGPAAYLNHATLSLQLPRLRTLVLRGSMRRPGPAEASEVPYPLCAGCRSPLQVISLDVIHPAWRDPIFTNLSHLCIRRPETRPTFMELLWTPAQISRT